jgi:N-acetylmuramoyl-L-alanine amidase
MAGYHTVVQGEHVPGIACSAGFRDYRTIWDHPSNADLKSKRQNPNVLFPGDRLFIPDREEREVPRPTDKRHRFVVQCPILKLRIVLEDQYERPITGASCLLSVDGDSRQLTTDGNGKLELEIPMLAKQSVLVIRDAAQTPHHDVEIPIKIGHLDPVEEITGQQARLNALGYFLDDLDGKTGPDFQSAVEEFQCEHALKVDGICGPMTQAKLKQVYGC